MTRFDMTVMGSCVSTGGGGWGVVPRGSEKSWVWLWVTVAGRLKCSSFACFCCCLALVVIRAQGLQVAGCVVVASTYVVHVGGWCSAACAVFGEGAALVAVSVEDGASECGPVGG